MDLPPGSGSGTRLRLRGKGVPRARGGRGDQIVLVVVETPAAQTTRRGELDRLLIELERESERVDALPRREHMRAAARASAERDRQPRGGG
jgi:DnaJ-class molecular chaperone